MSEWRVGNKVPINVYDGDRPVCQCHNEEDARALVDGMNTNAKLRRLLQEALVALNGEPAFNVSLRLDIEKTLGAQKAPH